MTSGRGHPINQSTEVESRVYVWDPRPNPATVVIIQPAQRKGFKSSKVVSPSPGRFLGRLLRTSVSEVDIGTPDSEVRRRRFGDIRISIRGIVRLWVLSPGVR